MTYKINQILRDAGDRAPVTNQKLLEQSRLSKISKRQILILDNVSPKSVSVVCAGCGGKLDLDNQLEQSTLVCRQCMTHYAKVDAALEEREKRERKELLEKFTGRSK